MNSNTTMALLAAGGAAYGYDKLKKLSKEQEKAMADLMKSQTGSPQNLSKSVSPLERVERKTIKPRQRSGGAAQVEGTGLMSSSSGGKTKLGGY